MFISQHRIRNVIIIGFIVTAFLFLHLENSIADNVSIKSSMKIRRMGGYVILINYQTRDKWTDRLLFKVHCKFDRGEFTFVSSSLNDIERGWHKTQVAIPEVTRKRYGSLREYKINLYRNGVLIDTKKSY